MVYGATNTVPGHKSESDGEAQPGSLSLHEVQGLEGLLQVYDDWLGLMSAIQHQSIFQHPAWYLAYFKSRKPDELEINFFCVFKGTLLVAVFPITFESRGVIKVAQLPRTIALFNSDFAISDRENKTEIWGYVQQKLNDHNATRWDVFLVRGEGAMENSCVVQCVPGSSGSFTFEETAHRCDVIEVQEYADSIALLKGNFRRDLKRRKRKLAEEAGVEYSYVSEPPLIEEAFDLFVDLEQSGWKGRTDTSKAGYAAPSAIGLNEWKYSFYRDLLVEFARLGVTEICCIRANKKPIAVQLCVVLNDTSFMLKTAYDETAKRYSPGHLGIDYLLKRYSSGKTVKYINLLTDYTWHSNWNPSKLGYLQVTQFNNTIIGRLLGTAYSIRSIAKNMVKVEK
jgi:CelD/BcsL family acetyltransferase involved in cellulose biosynthesis